MRKVIFLVSVIVFTTMNMVAQDFIYKRNMNERITATNINVLVSETSYNIFGDNSGEIYSIENNQISMIAYESGDIRFFEREKKIKNRHNYKKNIINYHLFDLVVNNFKLSYERIISKGKIGIQIPVAIGYGDDGSLSGFDDVYNTFYTGISLNFYPTGQGKVRYFMGPGIQVGTGYFEGGYSNDYNGQYVNENVDTFIFRFFVNNGIIFTPIEALSISLVGSLGIRYTEETDYYDDSNIKTVGAFSANLSYRF